PAGDRPASALLGCHRAGDRRGNREEGACAFVRRVAYRLFRSTSTFQYRLGRQLTPAGKFALAALVAAAVIGFDTNRTVGYQVFTLLAALLSVSTAWSGGFRVRLDVRRVLPRFVTAGEPAAYPVVIRNGTARPQRGLVLLEDLADPRPAVDEFLHAREPGEERRNWFDRTVGYPRWAWLVARKRRAKPSGGSRPSGQTSSGAPHRARARGGTRRPPGAGRRDPRATPDRAGVARCRCGSRRGTRRARRPSRSAEGRAGRPGAPGSHRSTPC